jgi:uncharacterized BrkB/YihY/UPF0761 family membrane protein
MNVLRRFAHRLWLAYMGFQEHEGSLAAAGIAYYLALSFFPLLLVLVAGLGWGFQLTDFGQNVQQQILAAIQQQVSADLAQQVDRMLKIVSERAGTSGPIGFVVLLISAIATFAQPRSQRSRNSMRRSIASGDCRAIRTKRGCTGSCAC